MPGAPGNGVILADAKFNPTLPEGIPARLYSVPFTKIAEEVGMTQMKNMVAVGSSSALLDCPVEAFEEVIEEKFARKDDTSSTRTWKRFPAAPRFILEEVGGALPDLQPGK